MSPHLNQQMLARAAERFSALADTTRLRLLQALRDGEKNVSSLSRELQLAQPTVSKHLGVLQHAGLVEMRREGTQSLYRVGDPKIYQMCELVCGGVAEQVRREYEALVHPRSPAPPPVKTVRQGASHDEHHPKH